MGGPGLSWQLRAQGGTQSCTRCPSIAGHTHSDWNSVDTAAPLRCTSLGCGRKPEHQEKTHAECANRQWPWLGIDFIVSSHWYYNETTLFKDLLHLSFIQKFHIRVWLEEGEEMGKNTSLRAFSTMERYLCYLVKWKMEYKTLVHLSSRVSVFK